jgi:hypothetical protein
MAVIAPHRMPLFFVTACTALVGYIAGGAVNAWAGIEEATQQP